MIRLIKQNIIEILKQYLPNNNNYEFLIEIPPNNKFGDFSTNVLMIYGKKVNDKNMFQEDLICNLKSLWFIEKINVIGNGFINLFIHSKIINNYSYEYINKYGNYENISIEYASPNPTGPCHIGHARGSIIGNILFKLYKYLGYNVRKDCIFNDGGNQVKGFIQSIFINYELLQNKQVNMENLIYKGEYVKHIASHIFNMDNNNYSLEEFSNKYLEYILNNMKINMIADLKLLGVEHDIITHESKLLNEQKLCWQLLKDKNLIIEEYTEKGIKKLFNSTYFEDDKDRVIEREDGSITYFGNDIAYHWKKKILTPNENFNTQIIILGDDHVGYLKRLSNAVLNFDIKLEIITHNLVKIFKDNKEIKMSKRAGNFITIKDFLNNYSKELLIYIMIQVGYNSVINLDLNNLVYENTILNNIQNNIHFLNKICTNINIKYMDENYNINHYYKQLINYIIYWPEFVIKCKKNLEVHLLLLYLNNICKIIDNIKIQKIFTNEELYILNKTYELILTIYNILFI